MNISKTILIISLSILAALAPAKGCDLCGCYNMPLDVPYEKSWSVYAGLTEQFTHFGTERLDGIKQPNTAGEYIDSSITQLVLGASFLDNRLGVQLGLPIIDRSYRRVFGFGIDESSVSGPGDLTLTANYIVFKKEAFQKVGGEPDFTASVNITTGIKLPTGDTSKLKENYLPEIPGAPESGIGPHDLTLGTGSVDGIFGVQVDVRYQRFFFQADAEYSLRGSGAYQYRFANDFTCSAGPGVYVYRKDGNSVGLQFLTALETKGYDTFQGVPDSDSAITELYIGPRVTASFGRFNGEIGVDLPVILNTPGYQLTPDYRIRAGFSIRF